MEETPIHSFVPANQLAVIGDIENNGLPTLDQLSGIGFDFQSRRHAESLYRIYSGGRQSGLHGGYTADNIIPPAYTGNLQDPNIGVPDQFLQDWLPGVVSIVTASRVSDRIMGTKTAGRVEDSKIVQAFIEVSGAAQVYVPGGDTPVVQFNTEYLSRDVIRVELAMLNDIITDLQYSRANINASALKRAGLLEKLLIAENYVSFYGSTTNLNTYGILNDPNLSAYITAATGAAGDTPWSTKTYLEITQDILALDAALLAKSGTRVDAKQVPTILSVASDSYPYLSMATDYNVSVMDWIEKTYRGRMRVVAVPEFNAADGDENVAYLYPENVADGVSTDSGGVVVKLSVVRTMGLGVETRLKGDKEGYLNAMAGAAIMRPYAVVRMTAI